jgi:hypothetical protein
MYTLFASTILFTLKVEAAGSSEMLVSYHKSAQCHNPEHLSLDFMYVEIFVPKSVFMVILLSSEQLTIISHI